jgi:beta-hydroxylase
LKNKLATRFNQFFSRTVMKAAASKNLPNEQVGTINKLFTHIYQIRLVGKKLKSYNKNLYYIIKYALFLSFIALFFI